MLQRFGDKTPRIHPTAWVHPSAVVIGDVVLGPRVNIWPGAVLRGDVGRIRVAAETNLQDGVLVHMTGQISDTIIGPRVTVGHGAVLHGCQIEGDALVGMGAVVLDNAFLGAGTIVGAGAVVSGGKRFETGGLLLGTPAVRKRDTTDADRAWISRSASVYVAYAAKHAQSAGEALALNECLDAEADGQDEVA